MKEKTCRDCGRVLQPKEVVCKECNPPVTFGSLFKPSDDIDVEIKRIRLLWVISVTMFWVTIGLLAAIFLVLGNAYLGEIVLFAGVFMLAGMILKTKMLVLQRKKSKMLSEDKN